LSCAARLLHSQIRQLESWLLNMVLTITIISSTPLPHGSVYIGNTVTLHATNSIRDLNLKHFSCIMLDHLQATHTEREVCTADLQQPLRSPTRISTLAMRSSTGILAQNPTQILFPHQYRFAGSLTVPDALRHRQNRTFLGVSSRGDFLKALTVP
jgi:hypothetical protein